LTPVSADSERLFLALWPDEGVRRQLADLVNACHAQVRGRPVASAKLHITLAFLGELPQTAAEAVSECVEGLPILNAQLCLDRLGYWPRNGIVWAGSRELDPVLGSFAADLRGRLARLGFRVERREFSPHVTLLRRARQRPRLPSLRIDWSVTGIALVRSQLDPTGSHYEVVRRWGA
jgi:2'-5' RNA ligase